MKEIAFGRKDILRVLGIADWRTVQCWKKKDPGFKALLHRHPINQRPFVFIQEVIDWMAMYNKNIK